MRAAFTLIELLAVLALLMLLAGISLSASRQDLRDAQVRSAAEQLAAVLNQARALADGTGQVLNNRSGGHWYRIIGPTRGFAQYEAQARIPMSGQIRTGTVHLNFPDFIEEVARAWVGQPVQLPARQVRFLALSDSDEGRRTRRADATGSGTLWYGATYPRPWFGYYDPAAKRLWPWGGYDPTLSYSGFYYQGNGGAVTGCRNPSARTCNNNFNLEAGTPADPRVFANIDHNGDGDVDDEDEREVGYQVWAAGAPRPLVNAAWLDACILFMPSGEALQLEWNRARRAYDKSQAALTGSNYELRNGVSDMAKPPPPGKRLFADADDLCPYDLPEVANYNRHTGGWFITLAPDVLADQITFASAAEAVASITPMYRVFIGSSGVVRVIRVRHQEGAFAGRTMWPAAPGDWQATGAASPVWRECRLGWLHQPDASATLSEGQFVLRGSPVSDVINTQMIANRQWWLDP